MANAVKLTNYKVISMCETWLNELSTQLRYISNSIVSDKSIEADGSSY